MVNIETILERLSKNPVITDVIKRFGGCLLYDKITGTIYHCGDNDGKTYYEKFDDNGNRTPIFWQMGRLNINQLEVIDESLF